MTRNLASLMLVLLGSSRAMAQIAPPYSFLPPNPSSLDDIQLRIETPSTCSSFAGESDMDLLTNTITVRFAFDDTCDPNGPQDNAPFRFVDIGRLPAGHYAVTVESCTDAPPPAPEFQVAATGNLVVRGLSATRHTVPALSEIGNASLTVLALMLALRILRRP